MANTFDRFDTPANTFDQFDKPEESTSAARKLGDLGISALRGAVAVPEAAVGLADIVTGGGAGKLAEQAGFRPKEAKDILADYYSPGYKAKQQQFQQADGVLDKTAVAITNPSLIANAAVESLPATFGGGLAARGILAAAPRIGAVGAGAIGEGVLGAGSAAEQIRQETPTGDLTSKQAALAALSGVGTAAFGYAGGKAAKALGIGDVDTLIAQGVRQAAGSAKPKGLARRAGEGFASEGFLEELPQSLSEQALQNVALDKPVTEGLADAAVMGTLTGGLMGGAAGAVASPPARSSGIDPGAGPISKAADKAVLALPAPVITVDGQGGAATADQRTKAKQDIQDAPFRDITAVPGEVVGPNPQPGGAPAQPLIGFDQTPTGTLIAGRDGITPQTRADAINVQQAADEREAARAAQEQRQIDLGMRPTGSRNIQEQRTPLDRTGTAPSAIETVANTEARAAVPAPAVPAAPKSAQAPAAVQAGRSFTTYDEAAQFISEQRKRGTSVQALPLPMADGTFSFAMKGTPDYTIAEQARKQNDQRKAGVLDGDVLSKAGEIFKTKLAANATLRKTTGAALVPVTGGFVVRPGGANTSATAAVGGVDSRTAVAAGTQPGGSAGTAAPLSAGNTNGVQPTAKAPAPGSGTNLPVRAADAGGAVAAPAVVPDTKPALGTINKGDVAAKNVAVDAPDVAGKKIDRQWTAFAKDSGTLGIPRADMPQIKADARGALVNYLAARGVKHEQAEVPATSLKPTQAEFSPGKVAKAKRHGGGDRSILVSSDGHILDGHHQWLAKREADEPVKVIRLNAPIKQLLADVREFPSAQASPPAADPATAEVTAGLAERASVSQPQGEVNGPQATEAQQATSQRKTPPAAAPVALTDTFGTPQGIDPGKNAKAPQWAGRFDIVEKGKAPAGYNVIGTNSDGHTVYEFGGLRAVEQGGFVVREQAGKPTDLRVAEWRTTQERGRADSMSTASATAPATPQKIEDLGEKIGRARKDTAVSVGTRGPRAVPATDARPAWARRFDTAEILAGRNKGQWAILDSRSLNSMKQPRQVGGPFATEAEALAAIPQAAVSQKHRAVPAGGGKYEIWRDVSDRKRVKVVEQQFDSRDAALAYMAANAAKIVETNTTFGEADLPVPANKQRIGPERRTGDVDGKAFMETFGFRGVEFGNWNNQAERQQVMNEAYDGLADLADVLALPAKAIGLNGDLALAFGARGQGLTGARAHYELGRAVINLTKINGAGALAHEWFHALDHYFGRQDGKASAVMKTMSDGTRVFDRDDTGALASDGFSGARSGVRPEVRAAYDGVIDTMFRKAEKFVEDTQRADKFVAQSREEVAQRLDAMRRDLSEQKDPKYWKRKNAPASAEQLAQFDKIAARIVAGESLETEVRGAKNSATLRGMRWTNDALEQLSKINKAVRGRTGFDTGQNGALDRIRQAMSLYSARLKMLADAQKGDEKVRKMPTDFAMDAKSLDQGRGQDYWTTPHEMAARAFQGYVEDKVAARDGKSPFLNHGPENAAIETPWGWKRPFPAGQERVAINEALQKLVDTLETKDTDTGTAVFRREDQPRTEAGQFTSRKTLVQQGVDALTGTWQNAPAVTVVADMLDPELPVRIRDYDAKQRSLGATGSPAGVFYGGKVYLVADQLDSAAEINRVLFHEALGHFGLQGVFGDQFKDVLRQVATMRAADVAAKAKAYGLDIKDERQRLLAAEEVLAELAESRPEIGFVARTVAAIRTWLRENVPALAGLKLTDAEIIRNYILPARGFVERGRSAERLEPNFAPAFSQSAMKSVDANVRRGAEAMNRAVLEKTDQNRAMFRAGLGWVDFVWGDNQKGLQHILDQRAAKDGLTREEAIKMLRGPIIETIAKGAERKRVEFGKSINLQIDRDGYRAVLVKQSGSNSWLLTGFELRSPGSPAEGFDSKGPTQTSPTRTQRGLGADDAMILPPAAGTVKGQGDTPQFSRTTEALGLHNPAALKQQASQTLNDLFNAPGKLNWWHKTVGTMYNLAQRSPEFKRVFDAGQAFINDVSAYATAAADLAPRILPKLETWRDIGKSPLSAADTKAISAPIFEGTLLWGRDEAGKLVRFAELEARHAAMSDDEKAQMLLRTGIVSEAELKRWKATPLPIYEGAIRNRFERAFGQPGVVFSDAELRGTFKLSDQQIGLYREFRTATDKSLNDLAVSDMLRYGGKDVDDIRNSVIGMDADAAGLALRDHLMEKARELPDRADVLLDTANKMIDKADRVRELVDRGYAPLSRFGQHTLDIVDKDGERVYFGLFESAMDAAAMQRRMVINFPEAKITRGTVSEEAYKLFAGVSPETLELFGDMLGLEAQGSDAGSKAFQEYLRLAKSNRSAMKRLIERKGIAGFSEDAGRVLAGFVYSNARQTAGNMHMGELTEATSAIPQQQGELKDAAFKMADYIKNPVEEAQAIRGLLFAQYLGGSIASAMVNMTQPIAVTTPYLSQFGGAAKAASRMTAAIRDALKPSTGDAALDAALKRAADEGIVAPQEVHQLLGQAQGRGSLRSGDGTRRGNAVALASNTLSKVSLAWGKLFSVAEQFNRRTTFIAAYRTAVEEGIADPAKFAEKAIAETQFVYNKGNKPAWARGAIGGTLFTFKQYSISYIELLTRMANAGTPGSPERAAGRRAALLAVGVMFLMGGAGGLPFADDLDDVIDGVMQRLGYSFSSKQAKKEFLTNLFGQGGARFIEGGISGLPGVPIDLSGRLGLGNVIPGTGLFTKKTDYTRDVTELVGPAGDFIKRGFQSANQLLQGDVGQAALTVSPTATRNLHQAFDMAMTGMYRDGKGKKVLDVDAYDVAAKAIGFQPTDVARVQEATGLKQNLIAQNKLRETEIADMWAMGMFEKDPAKVKTARDALARWNESNPTAPIVIKLPQIAKRVKEMSEDKATRIEKTAPKEIRASVRRDLAEDLR